MGRPLEAIVFLGVGDCLDESVDELDVDVHGKEVLGCRLEIHVRVPHVPPHKRVVGHGNTRA